jgi:type II secretory pathway predicted ATPase ExeA
VSPSKRLAPEVYYRDKALLASRVAYEVFFGLKENPFGLTPDPRYLFRTRRAHETLRQLTRGIFSRKGLILLTGEVGTGKTTLLNTALHVLRDNPQVGSRTRIAVLVHPTLTPEELVEAILNDFKVPCTETQKPRRLQVLHQMLLEVRRRGGFAVLAVDEAQLLTPELLHEIRWLLSFRSGPEQLLQVVLCGHPEIEEKIHRSQLCLAPSASIIRCGTAPLTPEDTRDYIEHRLIVAGARAESMFTPDASAAIHQHSHGIPRLVNLLCAQALSVAGMRGVGHITAQMVDEAAAKMPFPELRAHGRRTHGQHPGSAVGPAPAEPPISQPPWQANADGCGKAELRLNSATPAKKREFLNGHKTRMRPADDRRSPFRARPARTTSLAIQAPSQPSIASTVRSGAKKSVLARSSKPNRWWNLEFAKKRDWMVLCCLGLGGALFLTLAQIAGSADPWHRTVRTSLGFSGLLLLDVSLGLTAYFCILESRFRSRVMDVRKPHWPAYKRLPALLSLTGLRLGRFGPRDSEGQP